MSEEASNSSNVPLSEEFQKSVMELVKGASEQQVDFIQDCCQSRDRELYEAREKNKKTGNIPEVYSTEDMPKS